MDFPAESKTLLESVVDGCLSNGCVRIRITFQVPLRSSDARDVSAQPPHDFVYWQKNQGPQLLNDFENASGFDLRPSRVVQGRIRIGAAYYAFDSITDALGNVLTTIHLTTDDPEDITLGR